MSEILDSGSREVFSTGATRDIQAGKGLPSVMPLGVVAQCLNSKVMWRIADFQESGEYDYLNDALDEFASEAYIDEETMFLEVAKHFEDGIKKYGCDPDGTPNWKKGIPVSCYLDSMVRHYLKYRRGDDDEPHNRAFVWNVMCCIWTCEHLPEMNTIRKDDF